MQFSGLDLCEASAEGSPALFSTLSKSTWSNHLIRAKLKVAAGWEKINVIKSVQTCGLRSYLQQSDLLLSFLQDLLQDGLILSLLLQQLLQQPGVKQRGTTHEKLKRSEQLIKEQTQDTHLLVSSFILPSSMLTERCALWDSWDTVELSVLTPDVATVSSWVATAGARLWWVEFLLGSASSSRSSWSAGSLSEARLKWGLSSKNKMQLHSQNKLKRENY